MGIVVSLGVGKLGLCDWNRVFIALGGKEPPQCYYSFQNYVYAENLEKIVLEEMVSSIEKAFGIKVYLMEGVSVHENEDMNPWAQAEYRVNEKAIYLKEGWWCKVGVIHELLHAVSFFVRSRYADCASRFRPLIEVFTEFLTGYVIWKEHTRCFKNWLFKKHEICGMSYSSLSFYEHAIRALATLCRIISVKEIVKLYVWDSTASFHTVYRRFLEEYGLPDFVGEAVYSKDSISAFINAVEDLIRKHPRCEELLDLMKEAPIEILLDFSRMKL